MMPRDIGGAKRGRNDPCWCGSGLKYKRCHLDRAEQPALQTEEIVNRLYEAANHQSCSCPPHLQTECSGEIVKAHSLSRRRALDAITENGHVYSLALNWRRAFHQHDFSGRLLSSRDASTFTGFCGKHDNELFRPLDVQEFDGSKQVAVLSAYRTLCRELFAKRGQIRAFEYGKELDKGRDILRQLETQATLSASLTAARVALEELDQLKSTFDDALTRDDYTALKCKHLLFESEPDLLSCGGTNPTHDLGGMKVQDLADLSKPSEMIFVATLPSERGFWISFVWDATSEVAARFVTNLMAREIRLGTIYALCLVYVENTFLKPSSWDRLSGEDKKLVQRLAWTGVADDSYGHVPAAVTRLEQLFPHRPITAI